MTSRAERLFAMGQSVWLDFIRRGHLVSGEFDRLVREAGVVGVTSNPTIFQQAIAAGDEYDAAIAARITQSLEGPALFESIAVEDIQMACDRLRAVFDRTGGIDGRVSIEVSPGMAHDTAGTIDEAWRLHRSVARPNVYVKIPATAEGLPAITEMIGGGVSINVTLIFSLARYAQVMDAYLAGLERRAAQGGSLGDVFSVASFFVSRVDNKVDAALDAAIAARAAGDPERAELEACRGRAAIDNARLAYAAFRETFTAPRFAALRARGANVQRPLWASTSTKNPRYPDTLYVDELIGRDTVNTMPPQTLAAFNDHGRLEVTIDRDVDGARARVARLPALGVPLDPLIGELELEGVAAFAKSYDALLAALESRRREMAGARGA
ncbi:MAG: transaldolase [Candidatus Eisenbacteria bacterium]|uniref:Transaldolase n=1 Tax=Eiseniibacteriota bacterium TaxID=2212470 RepID=A0A9D6LBV0_UNCEI|nr:transaldolase [Candidatus Eisenbacteria bacterium]MBI3540273.1 transaldolase [Candidatus Eisenbacteria bacterium]